METHLRPSGYFLSLALAILFGIFPASAARGSAQETPTQRIDTVSITDLMTKAYAIIPAGASESEMIKLAGERDLEPRLEAGGLWLDSDDGAYLLCYSGETPGVSARAEYEGGDLDNFGYFFLFPYSCEQTKAAAGRRQCAFCGAMLQEMADIGMDMGADPAPGSGTLFDACGSYGESLVEISLIDTGDRYIVILNVEPGAYTAADNLTASL